MANILLIITGSIAAVKIPEFISLAKNAGHNVTCVLTKSASEFVTPLSLSYLTGNKAYDNMFNPDDEADMAHISLSRNADIVVVAPASADFLAKLANGFCDDLASTICLASDKKIIVAPAMNTMMLEKAATQRNLKLLKKDGIEIIDSQQGKLACGEEGLGKLADLNKILKTIESSLGNQKDLKINEGPLSGKKFLITSGPTRENIDPVRYISNHSSGKQGYAIAKTLSSLGGEVYLISGPTNLSAPENVKLIKVESAQQMMEAAENLLPVDVAICAAAVADWKPEEQSNNKIKKEPEKQIQILSLIENPDILLQLSKQGKNRPELVIGFAAETEHLIENALVKKERKGCDWIVANNVLENDIFGSEYNSVCIITDDKQVCIDHKTKDEVAESLCEMIILQFSKSDNSKSKLKIV